MTGLRELAAWTSPVLVGALAAHVCAGDPDAPFVVLAAAVAPLIALLAPPRAAAPLRHGVLTPSLATSIRLMVWANLLCWARRRRCSAADAAGGRLGAASRCSAR